MPPYRVVRRHLSPISPDADVIAATDRVRASCDAGVGIGVSCGCGVDALVGRAGQLVVCGVGFSHSIGHEVFQNLKKKFSSFRLRFSPTFGDAIPSQHRTKIQRTVGSPRFWFSVQFKCAQPIFQKEYRILIQLVFQISLFSRCRQIFHTQSQSYYAPV